MATVDLGQFETTVVGPPPLMRSRKVLVHVVHVTESVRDERCSTCHAPLPAGSELYLLNGRVECPHSYELSRASMTPATGFYPGQHFGSAPQMQRRRTPWRHRR